MSAAIRQAVREAIGSSTMRGKIISSKVMNGRTVLQVSIAEGDVRDDVELQLPYGRSAAPAPGSDVVLTQALGTRDHLVAHSADSTATRVAGLAPGEFGDSTNGVNFLGFRHGRIEIVDAGEVLRQLVTDAFVALFNAHTHPDAQGGETGPPSTPMGAAQLTGILHAGGQS